MSREYNPHDDLELDVQDIHLKEDYANGDIEPIKQEPFGRVSALRTMPGTPAGLRRQSNSPMSKENGVHSPGIKTEHEETVGGDVTVKIEPGRPPKLSRSTSHKIEKRPRQLFFDYPDNTAEACSTFDILKECTYANKHLGTTEHALECDCSEEWGKYHLCCESPDLPCVNI